MAISIIAVIVILTVGTRFPTRNIRPVRRVSEDTGIVNEGSTLVIENGVQIVRSSLFSNRYPAITVQHGLPVRWIINAPPGSINGCNDRMTIPEYRINHTFRQGENVIEFMPENAGRFRFACWMDMISSTITVLGPGESMAN